MIKNDNIYAAKTSDVSPNYTQWPQGVKKIEYLSSADNTLQPAMFYCPVGKNCKPLLVGLHTWAGDYNQSGFGSPYAHWCIEKNWAFIHPNFRGPCETPQATGSELVVQDIISAVEYAKNCTDIDISRIYLAGVSGGGYTALLMAGRCPQIWAAISAWVPISDLKAWYFECRKNGQKYHSQVADSCGGEPIAGSEAEDQCKKRSPVTYLENAKNNFIDINAGIHDGHTGSVYISHSFNAFNLLAAEEDKISQDQIKYFVEKEKVPPDLICNITDPLYGDNKVLFRRRSGKARITIFEGGHEMLFWAGLNWLSTKTKS
ncbi:MAG: hypothetical protein A2Y12_17990 [Planctomycetes bacterium GWF2_42_9]|nr:MAG: hypothetical protein A2Y12_17990 [Planctomycetes bacterium GWF2_42_9]